MRGTGAEHRNKDPNAVYSAGLKKAETPVLEGGRRNGPAAEGFGVRFRAMMNTLSVLNVPEGTPISNEQALNAVKRYCLAGNPDLDSIVRSGEYPVSWEIEFGDDPNIVVLFRSYTGAELRYYIDPASGDTYVTEFVSGVTAEEQRTDESFNAWDYVF